MGRKITLTLKQKMQIISFFENSHEYLVCPQHIENSAIIALFRACRDYCNGVGGNLIIPRRKISDDDRKLYRDKLIERLDKLSVRYYEKL